MVLREEEEKSGRFVPGIARGSKKCLVSRSEMSLEEEGIAREGKPEVARTAADARKFNGGSYWAERGVIFGAWGGAGVFSMSSGEA
jgi:hypothetical protein